MSSARAAAFTQKYPGIDVQANLEDVLRDPQVDAVIVATPPRTHHAIVKAALEAGKHVLVEKPLATTSADAVDLVRPGDGRRPGPHAGPHVPSTARRSTRSVT